MEALGGVIADDAENVGSWPEGDIAFDVPYVLSLLIVPSDEAVLAPLDRLQPRTTPFEFESGPSWANLPWEDSHE